MSLKRLRKVELSDLAEKLGIESQGTKVALEERIQLYLQSNPEAIQEDADLQRFIPNTTDRRIKEEVKALESSPGLENTESPIRQIKKYTAKAIQNSKRLKAIDLVLEKIEEARIALSNTTSINIILGMIEGIMISNKVWYKTVQLQISTKFQDEPIIFSIPDFNQFLNFNTAWKPIILWALISIIIPASIASLVRFSNNHTVDPFTYGAIKLVLILMFLTDLSIQKKGFAGTFVQKSISTQILIINSVTSIGFALYDAILKNNQKY